ncbi:MAG TPA: alcohol dehydrogenase catalytic domain-containing protein [Candidatus Acidoferrales bacterium]|nr:alcohol dehydrogenase catalytic domain-containing protein [Candidatus Acidoferrales bacterium]
MLSFVVKRNQLAVRRKPLPRLRPGWALVRVRLAGICNTDVEILRGYHDFHGTPGHEFIGEVTKAIGVSHRERKRWLGRRVVSEINISCASLGIRRLCRFCRRRLFTHCEKRRVLGIVGQDGAFAEYLVVPLANLHRVPEGVTDEQAVFTEPLAAACEILEQVPLRKLGEVAVLGDGKLAQLIARVLRAGGVRVTLFGKHANKLRLAKRAGIATMGVRGDAGDLRALHRTFPVVVEATGSSSGLALAQHLTEPRGTLVLKSTFHGAAAVETWPVVVKEITVIGSRCGPFGRALQLLRSRKVNPRPLIDRIFPLPDAARAIRFAQNPGVMKVLLKP